MAIESVVTIQAVYAENRKLHADNRKLQRLHKKEIEEKDAEIERLRENIRRLREEKSTGIEKKDVEIAHLHEGLRQLNGELTTKDAKIEQMSIENAAQVAQILSEKQEFAEKIENPPNSKNSHMSPSSDRFKSKRQTSTRERTGRSPGGQRGHKGSTLRKTKDPDHVVLRILRQCPHCLFDLAGYKPMKYKRNQIHDVPKKFLVAITDDIAEGKYCPRCECIVYAPHPIGSEHSVQYGPNIKALTLAIQQCHFVSWSRTVEILEQCTGRRISEGSLQNWNRDLEKKTAPLRQQIKDELIRSENLHLDETKLGNWWIYVHGTERATLLGCNKSRGRKALVSFGIINKAQGKIVHDCYPAYFMENEDGSGAKEHVLCNAHIRRELKGVFEQDPEQQGWAELMDGLLLDVKGLAEGRIAEGGILSLEEIEDIKEEYHRILEDGLAMNPAINKKKSEKQRGRVAQSKSHNLIQRLRKYSNEVLAFLEGHPFTNNQAERDLRPCKIRENIGVLRTEEGTRIFCAIRSVCSTAKKLGMPLLDLLQRLFRGEEVSFVFR